MAPDSPAGIDRLLSETELEEAIDAAKRSGDARVLQRLCFVKNCYAGDSAAEAARRVGVSSSTGARWAGRWNEAGVEGLRPDYGGGRPPKLDVGARERLRDRLRADGPLTTARVRTLLREDFDVDYAAGYLPRLLRSLGCSYRDPESVDLPADLAERIDGRTPVVGFFDDPK
jgi:transposase